MDTHIPLMRLNISHILQLKAVFPIRLIAQQPIIIQSCEYAKKGDELGIEAIDFSQGSIRVINKTNLMVFELYYDKVTGDMLESISLKGQRVVNENVPQQSVDVISHAALHQAKSLFENNFRQVMKVNYHKFINDFPTLYHVVIIPTIQQVIIHNTLTKH